jgi:hypothetical protein
MTCEGNKTARSASWSCDHEKPSLSVEKEASPAATAAHCDRTSTSYGCHPERSGSFREKRTSYTVEGPLCHSLLSRW